MGALLTEVSGLAPDRYSPSYRHPTVTWRLNKPHGEQDSRTQYQGDGGHKRKTI
jgi:hypothetical protein